MNIGKRGIATSTGDRGAHVTIGHGQVRETIGLPSTGLGYTYISGQHQTAVEPPGSERSAAASGTLPRGRAWRGWLWILMMLCFLALLVKSAFSTEVSPRAASESSPPSTFPWIAIIAAFGVGSIVSAIIARASARAVAIANHRQNWIDGLREDIVTFLKEIDLMHFQISKINRGGDTDDLDKQQQMRAAALLIRRRIRLRLNMTESPSQKLDEALELMMTIDSSVADSDRIEAVIRASAVVLKQEWEATKRGGLF